MNTGKMIDVFIEDVYQTDPHTGLTVVYGPYFIVWADDDLLEIIRSIEGVSTAYRGAKSKFIVYYDQRYNRDWVKREIEAVILCKE